MGKLRDVERAGRESGDPPSVLVTTERMSTTSQTMTAAQTRAFVRRMVERGLIRLPEPKPETPQPEAAGQPQPPPQPAKVPMGRRLN